MGRKVHWTEEQWIDYGERVKFVRLNLQAIGIEGHNRTTKRIMQLVFDAVDKLDKWKCQMEEEARKDGIPDDILTSIFYGPVGMAEAKKARRK